MTDANQGGSSGRIRELETKYRSHPESKLFLQLAEEYRNAGLYEKAIEVCKDGLKRFPQYASAHVTLGNAYLGAGKWSEACAELERAVELSPENIRANKLLGIACQKAGDLTKAMRRFKLVQMLNPGDAEVLRYIHEIESASKKTSPAAVSSQPSKAQPSNAPAQAPIRLDHPRAEEPRAGLPGAGFSDGIMDLKIDESVILNAQQSEQLRKGAGPPGEVPAGVDNSLEEIFGGIPDAGGDELSEFSAPTVMMSADEFMSKFGVSENSGDTSEIPEQPEKEEKGLGEPFETALPAGEMGMEIDSLSDFSAPTMMMSADELGRLADGAVESEAGRAESAAGNEEALQAETPGEGGECLEELFPEAFAKGRTSANEDIFGESQGFSLSAFTDKEASGDLLEEAGVESVFSEDEAVLGSAGEGLLDEGVTNRAESADNALDVSKEAMVPMTDKPDSLLAEKRPPARVGEFHADKAEAGPPEQADFSTRLDLEQIVEEADELAGPKTGPESEMGQDALSSQTLAELYVQQGHLERALEIYKNIQRGEPENQAVRERIQTLAARIAGKMEGSPLRQRETLFPAEPALSAERPAAEKLEAIETPLSSMGEEPAETGRLPGTGAAEKVAKGIADRKQKKVDRLSSWLSAYKKQKKS